MTGARGPSATRPVPRPADGGVDPGSRPWANWSLWLVILIIVTAGMFALRSHLDKAHVTLGFLIVVLGGSAAAGRALGVTLAVLAFLVFNFVFLTPYYTFAIANPLDWLVLGAFLITGVVAAQLLNRAQERAEAARQRAIEVARLASLGAETLNAGRAEDAVLGVLEVIRSAVDVDCCEILVPQREASILRLLTRSGSCSDDTGAGASRPDAPWSLAAWVAERHAVAAERLDGTKWVGEIGTVDDPLRWPPAETEIRTLLVPLMVRERIVGVLHVVHSQAFVLDPSRAQFLSALSYYAALGVERVALVAEAERAEAFRQADALKAALIAGLSHDLRTPLTTIKVLAHRLREIGSDEARSIEDEADRLNRLVADLLDLSRLNAGAMPIRPELNTAEDLIGAALHHTSGVLSNRRVIVAEAEHDGDHVLVGRFDFVQALRSLVNLLENADKYSPPAEPIELAVSRNGNALALEVADRGPGVADAERERIFEPFYRAPGALPDVGGAGLGLTIARRLAQEQGGTVEYRPRRGGGSVFTLRLPAASSIDVPEEMPPAMR
jgi:two-component system, OmpR family, sensor histidine kinase KdpD